jgi:hypothetical protein
MIALVTSFLLEVRAGGAVSAVPVPVSAAEVGAESDDPLQAERRTEATANGQKRIAAVSSMQ